MLTQLIHTTPQRRARRPLADRFMTHVEIITESGCWIWMGATSIQGYGNFWMGGKFFPAHRVSWILKHGQIESEVFVCHRCDIPCCVNPGHLFLGSQLDNMRDKINKGRLRVPLGAEHPRAVLTDSNVRYIRASTKPAIELARELGVNPPAIRKIRQRERWKHIN